MLPPLAATGQFWPSAIRMLIQNHTVFAILYYNIVCVCVYVCVIMHVYRRHGAYMEIIIRGQLVGVSSLLLP